jgi:hypothetical protein
MLTQMRLRTFQSRSWAIQFTKNLCAGRLHFDDVSAEIRQDDGGSRTPAESGKIHHFHPEKKLSVVYSVAMHISFLLGLGFDEFKQVGVDLVFVCCAQAVRRAFVNIQLRVFYQLCRKQCRIANRHDLIVVAVKD